MATWNRLVSSSSAGNVSMNIDYAVTNVSRSGNTVTFNYGIRFTMAGNSYTYNNIAAFCPKDGTRYYAFGGNGSSHTNKGTYYYASSTSVKTTTTETVPFSYSKTVGVNDTSLTFSVGFGWNAYTPSQKGSANITVTFPKGFTYPSWTKYTINSFPAMAYANMTYTYNIDLACSYGSSTSQNLLYWEGYAGSHGVSMVSTTGTSIGAGARTYTFANADIGSYNFRGVIRYNDGSTKYNVHSTTYPLTVSFLNPTLTGVNHRLNATSFYRTSTVTATTTATLNRNSASPNLYTYFSDTADAAGDGSGAGYYLIATNASANNVSKSYTHRGDRPGTFYTQVALNGNNATGWTNFNNYGYLEYTMQQFVAPTATRTITYNKKNVYVGQKKFPLTINVTATNKSQYDTLTPTMKTYVVRDGLRNLNVNLTNNFATGIYNQTLNNSYVNPAVGETISFTSDLTYKDALNADKTTSVSSTEYIVKPMPQPVSGEVGITLSIDELTHILKATVTGNFDDEFKCIYTLYIENASGTTIYSTQTDELSYDGNNEHTYNYTTNLSENYKARLVCKYVLADDADVSGSSVTLYSNNVNIYGGAKLFVKKGNSYAKFFPIVDEADCEKPRLVIKKGTSLYYLPLYTDTPSAGSRCLWVKQGSTSYYTLANTQFGKLYPSDDLYPEGNELQYEDLEVFTHQFLSAYTHQEIRNGDIE